MVKLKKKKTISPTKLVNQILRVEADAQGMSLHDFKKQRDAIIKSQEEYKKTHWVNDLTDAQFYYIATQQDKEPYTYMGKPLSRTNQWKLTRYKADNKNYANYLKLVERSQRLYDGIEKPLEPFKKLRQEYQEIGRRLRSSFFPEQEALRKMRLNLSPFSFSQGLDKGIGGLLDIDFVKARIQAKTDIKTPIKPVDQTHGLNTLMKKHKMKSPLDIADHFLKVYKDPKKSDYFVENYGNANAFAEACGILPVKVFELIAQDVKKRKKHYKTQRFINKALACEELVNEWNTKRSKDEKYPYSDFFRTKFRIDWSLRHAYDWRNYKRFMEDFPNWVRIFNARAKKFGTKEESDIDISINLINDSKLGK